MKDTIKIKDLVKDIKTTESRTDYIFLPPIPETENEEREMEERSDRCGKFKKTDEGYLTGRANITNIGVFPYAMEDGSTRWELRLPEEVFSKESLASLSNKPITNEHPEMPVNADNAKELIVGSIGTDVRHDAYCVMAPMTIMDGETIAEIQAGKRALSAGYSAEVEAASGVWMGVPYQGIQRNIRYNHVAIVDRGRAGDLAKIRMDSIMRFNSQIDIQNKKEDDMNLKVVKIDGVDYQAEAKVLESLHSAQVKVDQIEKDLEDKKNELVKLEAERDSMKDQAENLKKEIENLKAEMPVKIDEAVKSRIELLDSAKKSGIEVKEDMSELDIKKAVILKAFPKASEKLEKADTLYIEARYDSAIEYLADAEEQNEENLQTVSGEIKADQENPVQSAREKMIEAAKNAYKGV